VTSGVRQSRHVVIMNNGNADLRINAISVVYEDEVCSEISTRNRRTLRQALGKHGGNQTHTAQYLNIMRSADL
jgi:transcriptional regulator with PAS, ATPase and Fis domain